MQEISGKAESAGADFRFDTQVSVIFRDTEETKEHTATYLVILIRKQDTHEA